MRPTIWYQRWTPWMASWRVWRVATWRVRGMPIANQKGYGAKTGLFFLVSHATLIFHLGWTHFHQWFWHSIQKRVPQFALDPLGPPGASKQGSGGPEQAKTDLPWICQSVGQFLHFIPQVAPMHPLPATEFLPVGFCHFWPFPEMCFGPGTPETGPKCIFTLKHPQSFGKRVPWAIVPRS